MMYYVKNNATKNEAVADINVEGSAVLKLTISVLLFVENFSHVESTGKQIRNCVNMHHSRFSIT